jgi:hypothetical protein
VAASRLILEAQAAINKIDDQIVFAYQSIEEGIQAERIQEVLPRMYQQREQRIAERAQALERARESFWGIWGRVEALE